MAETTSGLQRITDRVSEQGERLGLVINSSKTKVMATSKEERELQINIKGEDLENVKEFIYLGGVVSQDGRCEADIKRRIGLTYAVFNKLANIWNCNRLAMGIKVQVYKAMVLPVRIYGYESWTMRKQDENRVLVAEMSWLKKSRYFKTAAHQE